MKNVLLYLILATTFIFACNHDDDAPIHTINCGNGYIANEDSTECICPKETHYEIKSNNYKDLAICIEKDEFSYIAKLEGRNCLLTEADRKIYEGETGYCKIGDEIFEIGFPRSTLSHFIFLNYKRIIHDDGRVEVSFKVHPSANCYDWKERAECPNVITGYGHGISNKENTKIDIRIDYKDCKGNLLDTGYMHLWKE